MRRGASGINLLVGIDKPRGLSSHDVVNRVRRSLGERRVGHAGTLDPLATGVLVVGVGQATRLLGMLTLDTKRYLATIKFGSETTTDDAEGEVTQTAAVPDCVRDESFALITLSGILGWQDQLPPSFSAISVGGRRSYERARAGEEVNLEPRRICVHEARLVSIDDADGITWKVDLLVSKGTYVRSIARDLGRSLGTRAHLAGLERSSAGAVTVGECLSLDELAELGPEGVLARSLDPVRTLGLAVRLLAQEELVDVSCGRTLDAGLLWDDGAMRPAREGERVSIVRGDRLMGVWECVGGRLRCTVNFPDGVCGVRI